jgi:L-iditol 2-dehydrogenase
MHPNLRLSSAALPETLVKAAVLEDLEKLTVKDVPTPVVDDDSVLVEVKACAVCGSDIRMFHHGNNRLKPPAIMGHEASGQVVQVGKNVTKFKTGDRVALGGDVPCGQCVFCKAGIGNNCQENYAMGYQFPGSFAEYVLLNPMVVEHGPVHLVPEHVSFEEAALAEPLGCILNALELCSIRQGDTLVVIGTGPLGCLIMEVGRSLGCTKVIAVNRSRGRLEMAKQAGADVLICSGEEDAVAKVLEATGGLGADVLLTACPSPQAQADAILMAKNRARINFFGGLPKSQSEVLINTNVIHYKELLVTGSHGCVPRHHKQAVDMIAAGQVDVKKYISHRFPLDQAVEAFQAAEGREGKRVVVVP